MISTARGTGSQSSLSASSNSNRSIHDSGTFTGVLPSRRGTHTLFTFLGKAHSSAGESAACSDRRGAHPRMHLLARRVVPIRCPDEGLLPRGELRAGDTSDPRNSDQTVLYFHDDEIARSEAVEIAAVDRNALETTPRSPGRDDEAAAWHGPGHGELSNYARLFEPWRRAIKRPVRKQQSREKPRDRNQPVIDAFERLDLRVSQCAPLDPHGYAERQKKQDADEDHDGVEFEGRIAAAGSHKRKRAEKKHRGAVQQPSPQRKLRRGRIQTTKGADIRVAFGSAI